MKKCLRFAALASLTAALIFVSFSLGIVIFNEKSVFDVNGRVSYSPADESLGRLSKNAVLEPVSLSPKDEDEYVLREYNGKVAIFLPDSDSPIRTLDVYVFTLPESVKGELSVGIRCDSRTLELYLEAFTS